MTYDIYSGRTAAHIAAVPDLEAALAEVRAALYERHEARPEVWSWVVIDRDTSTVRFTGRTLLGIDDARGGWQQLPPRAYTLYMARIHGAPEAWSRARWDALPANKRAAWWALHHELTFRPA